MKSNTKLSFYKMAKARKFWHSEELMRNDLWDGSGGLALLMIG